MGRIKTQKGTTVVKYLKEWPDLPNLTLAKKIYSENSLLFKDVERVRSMILYYTGVKEKKRRNKKTDRELIKNPGENSKKMGIPSPYYTIPESDNEEWLPYEMPKNATRILVLSDVHIPYHDTESLEKAIDYGVENKANAVLLNGDIMDCYSLSRWEKDPRKRRFSQELEDTRQFLSYLKHRLPDAVIYYKLGNHELRYEAFLRIKAPELLDVSEFRLDVLLRFGELGVNLITDDRIIQIGELNVMHGHEFGRSVFSPVNPARGYYMRSKTNILAGHNHQSSEHSEPNLNGQVVTAWSTGCLCHLHPDYMRINKWNHGFAFIKVYKDGNFEVDNLRIIKGQIR